MQLVNDLKVDAVADAMEQRIAAGASVDTSSAWGSLSAKVFHGLSVTKPKKVVPPANGNKNICEEAKRIEEHQWTFVLIYQLLVVLLSAVTVAILISLMIQLAEEGKSSAFQATAKALGALATGVAAKFVVQQRKDARLEHDAAVKLQEKHNC